VKTRKLLIVILVVVLLVVYYLLGTDYLKQRREHEALASQIAGATSTLAQMPPPPTDLETRLTAAQADMDTARNAFPDRLNSTRIIDTILILADDTGIRAIPLVTQPWKTENVNDISYSVFRLNIVAAGTFEQLSDFLNQLESGELETLVIEYLTVARATETPEEENTPGGVIPVSASLDIAIYAQPPPDDQKEE
jgi:hypothetical protein